MTSAVTARDRGRNQRRVRWELLTGLVSKDLKVKYQGSVLGFLWSLVNPLTLLVVYTFVFSVVLGSGLPRFGYYLLSGLLVWNLFAGSVSMATDAVVGNAGLVKKVHFPLGVLPLTPIGFNTVHYALQTVVLVAVMLITGDTDFLGPDLLLLVPAIVVAVLFTVALSFLVAALNVRYRDTKHLVEVLLMAGFWFSPIVYSVSASQIDGKLADYHLTWLYLNNPMTAVVMASQRALYAETSVLPSDSVTFYLEHLALSLVVVLPMLALGLFTYRRMSADFAEEL